MGPSAGDGADVVRMPFDDAPDSPGSARALVRRTLLAWDVPDCEDTLTLLVSELATNVVLHARTGYDVVLERRSDVVRLSVLDDSPVGPARRRTGLRAATGRGLALVEALSRDWGRVDEPCLGGRAKGIWCEVLLDQAEVAEGGLYGEDWLAVLDEVEL